MPGFDLSARMLEVAFTRGLGSFAAAYLAPGEADDAPGLPVRIILASRDQAGEFPAATPGLTVRATVLQVRVAELAGQGVEKPALYARFRLSDPGGAQDGALFEVDADPMSTDAARQVWTCPVSPPDPDEAP